VKGGGEEGKEVSEELEGGQRVARERRGRRVGGGGSRGKSSGEENLSRKKVPSFTLRFTDNSPASMGGAAAVGERKGT